MKPRLGYVAPAGVVLRPDASALVAELARAREEASASARDAARFRAALVEISSWRCDNRQLVALSVLGQLENR